MVDKEKVKKVLEKIRPQLQMDGGDGRWNCESSIDGSLRRMHACYSNVTIWNRKSH